MSEKPPAMMVEDDDDIFSTPLGPNKTEKMASPRGDEPPPTVEPDGVAEEEINLFDDDEPSAAVGRLALVNGSDQRPAHDETLTNGLHEGQPPAVQPSAPPPPAADVKPAACPPMHPAASAPPALAQKRSVSPEQTGAQQKQNDHGETSSDYKHFSVEIDVSEYEKRGEGMSAYYVFKVVFKPHNVPPYPKPTYEVWRRFSDFLGLHDKLAEKHVPAGRIVPQPPEKSVVGQAKTKMGKSEAEQAAAAPHSDEFLESRRLQLERFVRRVAQHPILLTDCDFRDFVTLQAELPRSSQTSALSSASVKKLFTRVGDALNKMTTKMDETDRWFEEKQNDIDELYEALEKLHRSADNLAHFRKELAVSTDALCKSLCLLAACEENTSLARALSQLAETQEKIALLEHDQADKDRNVLVEELRDYLGLLASVKDAFYERVKSWHGWQSAQVNLAKKREIKTRHELAGKHDKIPAAKAEVQEAEKKVQEMETEFGKLSATLRKELARFDVQRVSDFKALFVRYLETVALMQQQLVTYWEAFLPEAKAIIV